MGQSDAKPVRTAQRVLEGVQAQGVPFVLDGSYDGEVTVVELLTPGDLGLGTFNHLDGEMVVLHGTCHHLRSDGSARVAAGEDRTPFAAVTYFRPQTVLSVMAQSPPYPPMTTATADEPITVFRNIAKLSQEDIAERIHRTEGG